MGYTSSLAISVVLLPENPLVSIFFSSLFIVIVLYCSFLLSYYHFCLTGLLVKRKCIRNYWKQQTDE